MLLINDKKNRKGGIKKYLEDGTNFDRDLKDKRVVLSGNLNLLDKTITYTQKNKNYKENYKNYVLSLDDDEEITEEKLKNVANDFIKKLMVGYADDEYIAYAEAHLPRILYNSKGEKRRKHIHISVAKYSPKLDRQLDLGDNKTRMRELKTIKKWLELKYNLKALDTKKVFSKDFTQIYKNTKSTNRKEVVETITQAIQNNINNIKNFDELKDFIKNSFDITIEKESTAKAKTPYITIKVNNLERNIKLKGALFSSYTFLQAKESLLNNKDNVAIATAGTKVTLEEVEAELNKYKDIRTKIINSNYGKNRNKIKDKYKTTIKTQKAKNYISYQTKILEELYNYNFEELNIGKGYFVAKYENTGFTTIANRNKSVKVVDKGNKIVAINKNLKEQAKITVELALAKKWDLNKLKINGSEEWQNILKAEIKKAIDNKTISKEKTTNMIHKNKQFKTPIYSTLEDFENRKELEMLDFKTLKQLINPNDLLTHLENVGILKVDDYTIKNNLISYKNKNYNIVDFCIKHLNLNFKETNVLLNEVYRINIKKDLKKGDKMSKFDFNLAKQTININTLQKVGFNINTNNVFFDKAKNEYRIKVANKNLNIVDYLVKIEKLSFKQTVAILEQAQKFNNDNTMVKEKTTTKDKNLEKINEAKKTNWGVVLENMGYKLIEKGKWQKWKNDDEEIIIYKNKKDGLYKFFNQDGSENGDLYTFMRNRGITKYEDIVEILDGKTLVDNLETQTNITDDKNLLENLSKQMSRKLSKTALKNEVANFTYLYKDRYLSKDIVDNYRGGLFGLSSDYYGNIINKIITVNDNNEFVLCGFQKKGTRVKAMIEKGSEKYISILMPKDIQEDKKIQVIMCESYIDGLALTEQKQLKNAIIVDIMGNYTSKSEKGISDLLEYLDDKDINILSAFDNDDMGNKYTNKLQELIKNDFDYLQNRVVDTRSELKNRGLKDFNDLLVLKKLENNEITEKYLNTKFKHLTENKGNINGYEEREIK